MHGYLSADIICSEKRTAVSFQGTDNVQGQISGHIFAPNVGYCLYYPSNIFRNTRGFKNWGISSDIPQFWLGNIRSRDAFRPIARERKYLMDYKPWYTRERYITILYHSAESCKKYNGQCNSVIVTCGSRWLAGCNTVDTTAFLSSLFKSLFLFLIN